MAGAAAPAAFTQARPSTPTPASMTSPAMPSSNVFGMASQGLQQAGAGAGLEMMYTPQQINAGQIAGTDLAPYTNPYTSEVIGQTAADLERQRQMQQNVIGAQASAAGAFGGSRQGVAESLTNEAFARQLAQTSAGLRQAGFQQAQTAAQQDIANRMQAALANQEAGLAGSQQRLSAGSQLGSLANLGFGMGQAVTQQMAQQGAQQQALQQALIDAAKGQFAGYTGAPASSIQYLSSALGSTPVPQTQTTSQQPGLFDYLTLAAAGASAFSDVRLKEKIKHVGNLTPEIGLYEWEWNDEAKRIGVGDQATVGVIAQEVKDKIPGAVMLGDDGYFKVNYDKIAEAVR